MIQSNQSNRGLFIANHENDEEMVTKKSFALLIGINSYVDQMFPNLKYGKNDVESLGSCLQKFGYEVCIMHDESNEQLKPTRSNIKVELASICEEAEHDDLILFHFSGHGRVFDNKGVLITSDSRYRYLEETSLALDYVKEKLRSSRARKKIIILDACHLGVESGRDIADPDFIKNVNDDAEGLVILAASTSKQVALEHHNLEHGAFTYFLLDGLSEKAAPKGQSFVTVQNIADYVLNEVRKWNKKYGFTQTPTKQIEGFGDIIVVDWRGKDIKSVESINVDQNQIDDKKISILIENSEYKFGNDTGIVQSGIPQGRLHIEVLLRVRNHTDVEGEISSIKLEPYGMGTTLFDPKETNIVVVENKNIFRKPPIEVPQRTWNMRLRCWVVLGRLPKPNHRNELLYLAKEIGRMTTWKFQILYDYELANGYRGTSRLIIEGNYDNFKEGCYEHWRQQKQLELINLAKENEQK